MTEIVSYGGGNNSASMLVGLWERGERPDAILFADTGGEKPHTYGHMWRWMQPWLERIGFPSITIVRGEQPQQRVDVTLETECLRLCVLPSKTYGFASCSDKWKKSPQEKWISSLNLDTKPTKLIGFHAGEWERAWRGGKEDSVSLKRYPLIEWEWDGEDCVLALARVGIPAPGKSACFFCPSSKKGEILGLRERYPELLGRALEIERRALAGEGNAVPHSVKGLGRRFSWAQLIRDHDATPELFDITPEECSEACFT